MNGIYGITVKEGLVSATEVVVLDVLNSTYPRVDDADADVTTDGAERVGATAGGDGVVRMSSPSHAKITPKKMNGARPNSSGSLENYGHNEMKGVRVRVEGLPGSGSFKNGNDRNNRRLAILAAAKEGHQSLHHLHAVQHKIRNSSQQDSSRSLVYYTQLNPIIITDIDDVIDQACPPGINCMRVKSTIYVTLEEGDDAAEVESVIWQGFQDSLEDSSFFESIPSDTIFCPILPTASPSIPQGEPTTAPSVSKVVTSSPTTLSPVAPVPSSQQPTTSPVTVPGMPTTTSPATNNWPSWTPTTQFPTSVPSEMSFDQTGPMDIEIRYDITNDCGLDAEAVMNEEGNTLKVGLEEATATITIGILNQTFPGVDDNEPTRRRRRNVRGLAHLDSSLPAVSSSASQQEQQQQRSLVYYTAQYPVVIDRILDIDTGCAPGSNCLLIISTITVILEAGDNPDEVSTAIVNGIQESFVDGSFFGAIPADTIIC